MPAASQPRSQSRGENRFFQEGQLDELERLVAAERLPDLMQHPIVMRIRRLLESNGHRLDGDVDYRSYDYPTVLAQILEQSNLHFEFSQEEGKRLRDILRTGFQQRLTSLVTLETAGFIDLSTGEPEDVLRNLGLQTMQFSPERQLEMIDFVVRGFRQDRADRSGELMQLPYMINLSPEAEMALTDVLQKNPPDRRLLDSATWGTLAERLASVAKDTEVQRTLMELGLEDDPQESSVLECLKSNPHLNPHIRELIYQAQTPL